nr:putative reverse transcriptase domain, aspartic peptidase domain protein [Tanacetum cinerariifolium]
MANNLPPMGGHSIMDPSCDFLRLRALYPWKFILKFHLHAYRALLISTPLENVLAISLEFRSCPLRVGDNIRFAKLLYLGMSDFDIILGMDWLTQHRTTIDCHTKRVILGNLNNPEFIYLGFRPGKPIKIISALKAQTLISHVCEELLAYIKDTLLDGPFLVGHPVARNFLNVFPNELPGLPPEREVEFTIELIPGAQPISKALEEHEDRLRIVLEILQRKKLYAQFSECDFWLGQVAFLGHIVLADGITMDPTKVDAIT